MKEIILWGAGNIGCKAFEALKDTYNIIAFGDNDNYKQGLFYKGLPVISLEELKENYLNCQVVISIEEYYDEAKKLDDNNICVLGYYDSYRMKVLPWERLKWEDLKSRKKICLYAGDIYENFEKYPDKYVICLSLTNRNYRCIKHDIRMPYPIEDNSIDYYQIEDVIEHIEIDSVVQILNEIYRVIKKGGYLRLSMPDYHSKLVLYNSFIDSTGTAVYDPTGGGNYTDGKIYGGGHLWFPTYELIKKLLEESKFKRYKFYRYHSIDGKLFSEKIDYEKGYISRTKENSLNQEDISIVVDCYK